MIEDIEDFEQDSEEDNIFDFEQFIYYQQHEPEKPIDENN